MNEIVVIKCQDPTCQVLTEHLVSMLAQSKYFRCENCGLVFEHAIGRVPTFTREQAARTVIDMATRYDFDIEGCDGDQLIGYTEAINCCFRLAYILKYDKFPPEDNSAWSVEFAEIAKKLSQQQAAVEKRMDNWIAGKRDNLDGK